MSEESYLKKIIELIYNYKEHKFLQVNNLQFVQGMSFDANNYKEIAESLRAKGIKAIEVFDSKEKSFEDLTIYKFSDQNGKHYIATIYDNDDLWQDLEILDIFELVK